MRTTFFGGILLAGCFGAAACSSTPGGQDGGQDVAQDGGRDGAPGASLGRSSWEVSLSVTVTTNLPFEVSCSPQTFTMYLEPQSGGLGATLGHNGWVVGGGQLAQRDQTYELVAPLAVPSPGCDGTFEMTRMSLHPTDGNGDGVAEQLVGDGTGTGHVFGGDVGYQFSFSFTLSGTPDVTRPKLMAPGVINPVDGVMLAASEALALTSQLSLQGTSSVSLTGGTVAAGAFGTFSSDLILPFSGHWTVAGSAEDLIGLPIETGLQLASLADPGVFAQDGFEGTALAAVLTGQSQVVSNVGSLPALSGNNSLEVSAGTSATLHLARPPGATAVRYVFRALRVPSFPACSPGGSDPFVTVGVIGGVNRPRPVVTSTGDPVAVQSTTVNSAGPLQEVSVPLDEAGGDVVVRIAPLLNPNQTYCFPGAVLVDDLRVE